jgi:hypothetical protein
MNTLWNAILKTRTLIPMIIIVSPTMSTVGVGISIRCCVSDFLIELPSSSPPHTVRNDEKGEYQNRESNHCERSNDGTLIAKEAKLAELSDIV